MSPEERREVLEALLARVRQTAAERGLQLPDAPSLPHRRSEPAIPAEILPASAGPPPDPAEQAPLLDDAPRVAPPASPSRPLVRFEFEDEITATGDPEEIERLALMQEPTKDGEPEEPEPSTLPPEATQQRGMQLELDDLDSLGPPPGSSAPAYPEPVYAQPPAYVEPAPAEAPLPVDEEPAPVTVPPERTFTPEEDDVIELEEADLVSAPPPRDAPDNGAVAEHASYAYPAPAERAEISDESSYEGPSRETVLDAPPAFEPPPAEEAAEEEAPASQRQPRVEGRPIDDALEGVEQPEEPPPESGEVESQRYPSQRSFAAAPEEEEDEAPTPRPVQVTAAPLPTRPVQIEEPPTSALSVEVVARPAPAEVVVANVVGSRQKKTGSFGEILDDALALGQD